MHKLDNAAVQPPTRETSVVNGSALSVALHKATNVVDNPEVIATSNDGCGSNVFVQNETFDFVFGLLDADVIAPH